MIRIFGFGVSAYRRDAIRGVFANTVGTACISGRLRKLGDAQDTVLERFPKLDVAASGRSSL